MTPGDAAAKYAIMRGLRRCMASFTDEPEKLRPQWQDITKISFLPGFNHRGGLCLRHRGKNLGQKYGQKVIDGGDARGYRNPGKRGGT